MRTHLELTLKYNFQLVVLRFHKNVCSNPQNRQVCSVRATVDQIRAGVRVRVKVRVTKGKRIQAFR